MPRRKWRGMLALAPRFLDADSVGTSKQEVNMRGFAEIAAIVLILVAWACAVDFWGGTAL